MKIYKYIPLLIIILLITSCGIKSDPVSKSKLDIPYPQSIDYAINSDGVSIHNGSSEYTLFVEKADESSGFFNLAAFKRVALINPNQTYTDTEVVNNRVYKYRVRHYYNNIHTYSPALMKTIKYYTPIKHSQINIKYDNNKRICVDIGYNSAVSTTFVKVNGIDMGEAKNSAKTCFSQLPENVATLSVMAIPYDKDNNTGIPYQQVFKIDTSKFNLPPQNISVLRKGNDIIITWDKEKDSPLYNVYIVRNGNDRLLKQVDVEIFRYKATSLDNNCIDFKLSSVRNGKESNKISVSSCK